MLLIPLRDNDADGAQVAYEHALRLYQSGRTEASHQEALAGWTRYRTSDPDWAGEFLLLDAKSLLYLGKYGDVLTLLASDDGDGAAEGEVQRLALEASARTQLRQLQEAEKPLEKAEALCRQESLAACGTVMSVRGTLSASQKRPDEWRTWYLRAFAYARAHKDVWREANASQTLGYIAVQSDHPGEAIDWSRIAYQIAVKNGYDDVAEEAAGNEGYAWYQLGDGERALEQFEAAEKAATGLRDFHDAQIWISNQAYVHRDRGDLARAEELDGHALRLAQQIGDQDEEIDTLGDLANLAILASKPDEADDRLQAGLRMEAAAGRKAPQYYVLLEAQLAAVKHDYAKAEDGLHVVLADKTISTAIRLNAGNDMGLLDEAMGKPAAAEQMYKATIAAWSAAREQLKRVELRLSYGTNASEIYGNYVRFLVQHRRTAEALALADGSRARTLMDELQTGKNHTDSGPRLMSAAMHPEQIARKTGSTLLFYWLGEKEDRKSVV